MEEKEFKSTQIDPEAKKIDTMLKLGVVMVGISGLIFATTSWDVISNIMKVFALIFMAALFLGLSKFSEIKLKLKNTTITYWILSMIFIILAFLSAGYFEVFGKYFSLFGEGSGLFKTVLWLLFSGIGFITYYNKFKYDAFLYSAFIGLFLALATFLRFIDIGMQENLVIFISLLTLFNFLQNKENRFIYCLNKLSLVSSIVLWFFIAPIVILKDNGITSLILRIVTLINIYHITIMREDKDAGYFAPFITIFLLFRPLEHIWGISNLMIQALIYAGAYLILLITKQLNKNKSFSEIFCCAINFSLLILFLITHASGEILNGLIIAISSLAINFIYELVRRGEDNYGAEHFLQPFKVLLVGYAFLDYMVPELALTWHLLAECLLILLLFFFTREPKLKIIYFTVFFILSVFAFLNNSEIIYLSLNQNIGMVAVILTFISTLVPFYITQINDNQYKQFEVPSFILMLLSILTFLFSKEVFIMQETMRALTVLVIYIVLAIAYRNRKVLYTISTIATVVPFNIFLRYIDVSNNTNEIIQSAFYLILVPLLCRNIEKLQDRDTVSTILYIYIMLPVIFTDGLEIGLYVGFVSLLMILFGFIKKGYRLMFRLGVTITIVNIIFQLRELWLKIPFWLYLLLAGMILIGLVMYKAINKMKK